MATEWGVAIFLFVILVMLAAAVVAMILIVKPELDQFHNDTDKNNEDYWRM